MKLSIVYKRSKRICEGPLVWMYMTNTCLYLVEQEYFTLKKTHQASFFTWKQKKHTIFSKTKDINDGEFDSIYINISELKQQKVWDCGTGVTFPSSPHISEVRSVGPKNRWKRRGFGPEEPRGCYGPSVSPAGNPWKIVRSRKNRKPTRVSGGSRD